MDRRESYASGEDTLGPMHFGKGKNPIPPAARRGTMMPRKSIAAGMGRPSVWSISKKIKNQEVKFENTYRLEPSEDEKFMSSKIKPLVLDILAGSLKDSDYDAQSSGPTAKTLTEYIRDRIKDEGFERYKFVINVFIGTKQDSNITIASQAIWAPEMGDCYIDVDYSYGNQFALATVHAFYFD